MCGIVGLVGNLSGHDAVTFGHLLFLDQLRGRDSTGVGVVTEDKKVFSTKCVGGPEFLKSKEIFGNQHVLAPVPLIEKCTLLLGHNRYATVGNVTEDLAHPFDLENILAVHNGTLRSGIKFDKETESDSLAMFKTLDKTIAESGADYKAIGNFLSNINGAMSIVFYCKIDGCLYFYRNTERPMYFAYPAIEQEEKSSTKTIYYTSGPLAFASEQAHLKAAFNSYFSRRDFYFSNKNKPDRKTKWREKIHIESTDTHVLFKFKIPDKNDNLLELLEEDRFFLSQSPYGKITAYGNLWPNSKSEQKNKDTDKEDKKDSLEEIIYEMYAGIPFNQESFELFMKEYDCCVCGNKIKWEERHEIEWYYFDTFTCGSCKQSK